METLDGRRILITGGTSGIGYATAARMAAGGARVFLAGHQAGRLSEAKAALGVGGALCNVRSFAACERLAGEAARAMGGVDALVNSAGVGTLAPISELGADEWRDMIDTNVTGTFNACKAVLPWLMKSERPDIVNLGSRSGRYAFAGGTGYCASKFAIQGFSEALFLDVSQYGVGVSLVAPGTVGTGFGGTEAEDWHLQAEDVAETIVSCLTSHRRANLNWIEMRPSRRGRKEE